MGSLAGRFPDGDVAPFKLLAYNSARGVDFFVANSGGPRVRPGKNPGDRIGQYRNLLIWLRPGDRSLFFQWPKTAKVEIDGDIWFVKLEKTWLAIRAIDLSSPVELPPAPGYPDEVTYQAEPKGSPLAGFALEVGEEKSHGKYDRFKSLVKSKSQLDVTKINSGKVKLQGATGESLELIYSQFSLLPILIRNGKFHDWRENFALYNSLSPDKSPVSLGWKEGTLNVKAGGYKFSDRVPPGRLIQE
jgi:hypothetical protein